MSDDPPYLDDPDDDFAGGLGVGDLPRQLLRQDLKAAADSLTISEARYLVDAYYAWQRQRIGAGNQAAALARSDEPHQVITWAQQFMEQREADVRAVLDVYTRTEPTGMGRWCRSVCGIGPVIAAGLITHLDITRAPTVGHWWRFAGYDPTVTWEKGQKRPWNASLKVVCYKLGESFVKVQGRKKDVYGRVYAQYKAREGADNEAGRFAEQAERVLATRKIGHDTDAYLWYAGCLTVVDARAVLAADPAKRQALVKQLAGEPLSGQRMLPPAHIHARARRKTVKLFLSALHGAWYRAHYGVEPPLPYVLSHQPGAHTQQWDHDGGAYVGQAEYRLRHPGDPASPSVAPAPLVEEGPKVRVRRTPRPRKET